MSAIRKIKEAWARSKQARLIQRCTVDFQHYVVVENILYDTPNAFTSTPQYRPYDKKDFMEVVEQGVRLLDEANLGPDDTDILDRQSRLHSLLLESDLAQSRLLHVWNALHNRSDVLSQLRKRQIDSRELQEHLDKLMEERAALNPEQGF